MIAIMFEDLAPLLGGLAGRDLALESGRTLFRQDDPVREVFFVSAGVVHLVRHRPDGAPLILQRAGPGAILAEASLASARYHCDAVVAAQARLRAVAKADLVRRIAERPETSLALIRRLAHELQTARFQAELLAMKTVGARLDAWIGWHGALPPKGQWAALAAELGVSPEALYRDLAKRQPGSASHRRRAPARPRSIP